MESHNHPSYIEPIRGRRRRGGILRDVFTMGARPIACLDALSFGDPSIRKRGISCRAWLQASALWQFVWRADGGRASPFPHAL